MPDCTIRPSLDDEDLVGVADRREPVRDDQRGPPLEGGVEGPLDGGLGLAVEVRGRLVEDDDRRRLEQQPGDREPLPLAAGEPVAAVADDRVDAVGQGAHQVRDLGRLQGVPHLEVGGAGPGVEQVGADRVVEHVGVLGDVADDVLQGLQRHVAYVVPADAHRAGLGVVQPGDQVRDRGLAGTGRTDQRDHVAALGDEVDVGEHLTVVAGLLAGHHLERGERDLVGPRVAERDVLELEADRRSAAARSRPASPRSATAGRAPRRPARS